MRRPHRFTLKALAFCAMFIGVASVAPCSAAQEFSDSARIKITGSTDAFKEFHPQAVQSAFRSLGLFIGVSRFEKEWLRSTPAHSLGAALAFDALYSPIRSHSSSVANDTASKLESRLTMVTELRMAPDDKQRFFPGLVDILRDIRHPFPVFEYVEAGKPPPPEPFIPLAEEISRGKRAPLFYGNKVRKDGTFRYFGMSPPMTRSVMLAAIDAHVAAAGKEFARLRESGSTAGNSGESLQTQLEQPLKLPLLVTLYVATHGVLWSDGEQYLMPSDAVQNDPATWISVKSVVDRYRALADPTLGRVGFLLMFDACNTRLDGVPEVKANGLEAFPTSAVVIAASPGEPAFHWNSTGETKFEVKTETAAGLLGRKKSTEEKYRISFESRMSALPLAMLSTLAQKEKAAARVVATSVHNGVGPSHGVVTTKFGVDAWLGSMQEQLNLILAEQKLGGQQTLLISNRLPETFKFFLMFDLDQLKKAGKP